jgi:MFS transporter, MFS domain-containing protein family, molybdate-anion transporter
MRPAVLLSALVLGCGLAEGLARARVPRAARHCAGTGSTCAPLHALRLRGGAKTGGLDAAGAVGGAFSLARVVSTATATPTSFFNAIFLGLLSGVGLLKGSALIKRDDSTAAPSKPASVKSLQARFLVVFWLLRMADWLQGPYFYEVYSSKVINGSPVSLDMVSKLFLVGFASTGIFGPWIGKAVDSIGRKAGTLAFAVLYTLGALSTRSSLLPVLLAGRVAGGIGTSLLFSAPEAWLVGEHQREKHDDRWLGDTFGLAYAGDALVAIGAGQLASAAAAVSGPTGPFTASVAFLVLGAVIAGLQWGENTSTPAASGAAAADATATASSKPRPTIPDALAVMKSDKKILLVGAMQALFEGAMYIFVLQWCPAIKAAVQASPLWAGTAAASVVPFGKIFSCFMANCLLGATLFSAIRSSGKVKIEHSAAAMMVAAAASMTVATKAASSATPSLGLLVASFFAFEATVGMYFPSIGTLRGKYIPDSHRSVIMNIFGLPLNVIVVGVFLSIKYLGVAGAMSIASGALSVAALCAIALARGA